MAALVLYDTNILIDATKGYAEALAELAHWDSPAISSVTWMELYAGADVVDVPRFDTFMAQFGFEIIEIDVKIMKLAARIVSQARKSGPKIALPDAIIGATARINHITVITRNSKHFKGCKVRVPYELKTTTSVSVVNVRPRGDTPDANSANTPKLTPIK
jgi:predicted nucleic acid-binding protein